MVEIYHMPVILDNLFRLPASDRNGYFISYNSVFCLRIMVDPFVICVVHSCQDLIHSFIQS